jgi:hypothetical protein
MPGSPVELKVGELDLFGAAADVVDEAAFWIQRWNVCGNASDYPAVR